MGHVAPPGSTRSYDGGGGNDTLAVECIPPPPPPTPNSVVTLQDPVCQINGKLEMDGGDGNNSCTILKYMVTGKTEIERNDKKQSVDWEAKRST